MFHNPQIQTSASHGHATAAISRSIPEKLRESTWRVTGSMVQHTCNWRRWPVTSVYNLKRRIAFLPPIPLVLFEDKIRMAAEPHVRTPKKHHAQRTEKGLNSPRQCLFCHLTFEDDTEELNTVIGHMFTTHGLFIPDQAMLLDPTSFLGYLATQVRVWHECLYCGIIRTSTPAIQDHMKDSGHCMLNLEREPELSEFWEHKNDAESHTTNVGIKPGTRVGQELQLHSGKTVVLNTLRRQKPSAARARKAHSALPAGPEPSQSQSPPRHQNHRLSARRGEEGIQNITSQQHHALVLAVKRSQKDEAIATRAKEWTYARKANNQKHNQAYGTLSWAKGGMHNLLPR